MAFRHEVGSYGTRNRRRRKNRLPVMGAVVIGLALTAGLLFLLLRQMEPFKVKRLVNAPLPEWVDVQLIDIDGVSRRGEPLDGFKDVVVHYIGNAGTSAQQNRNWFQNPDSQVSSHFVIGIDGEVIQCVPLDEKSSASNWRNNDTISIEVCHPDLSGAFTPASYDSLVRLTAWLCKTGGIGADDVIRHYDITQKRCPLYFVDNEDAWLQFKEDVRKAI